MEPTGWGGRRSLISKADLLTLKQVSEKGEGPDRYPSVRVPTIRKHMLCFPVLS